jgi:reductive dehalogenase
MTCFSPIWYEALLIIAIAVFIAMLWAAYVSFKEKEQRAAKLFLATSFVLPLFIVLPWLIDNSWLNYFVNSSIIIIAIAGLFFLLPIGKKKSWKQPKPVKRIDERDTMFSRNELIPGTKDYKNYYSKKPEKEKSDNLFKSKPGLLAKGATQYNPFHFASADASFDTVAEFKQAVDGPVASEQIKTDSEEITQYLKSWAKKLGAVDVGITELEDYHLYSVGGRAERRNRPIEKKHDFALAFTVEMDREMMMTAPASTVIMESAQQYLEAGRIAMQLASFIRKLGYEACAHIDGNYEVICPLVARDAGLGELGRIGLLMTKKLGPRVRIGVVTTNLPLVLDKPLNDYSFIDFCIQCKKCADVCPSKAISFEDIQEIDGIKRWQINQELCFNYWSVIGTDCGKCVAACPFSHPDNALHNIIRAGIRQSAPFRKVALKLDDMIYGRKPKQDKKPEWTDINL